MTNDLSITFDVEQSPAEVFSAINNVRAWWSGEIEGDTDRLDAEFSYSVPDIHYSKFRITEYEPGKQVAWYVTDSLLTFVADKEEWTGTTVIFDIEQRDGKTRVTFTHEGLAPQVECYEACSTAWGMYIGGSLRNLISSGKGAPNSFEGEAALAAVEAQQTR